MPARARRPRLAVEVLEDRTTPSRPGDPDPTFGGFVDQGGRAGEALVPTDLVSPLVPFGGSVAPLPDGKIVMAGSTYRTGAAGGQAFALVRFHPDGRIDRGFGANGVVKTSVLAHDTFTAVAVRPDGRILVAGIASHNADGAADPRPELALVCYNSDGTLYDRFGSGGVVRYVTFGPRLNDAGLTATGIVVQPGGRILLGVRGTADLNRFGRGFHVVGLTPTGQIDASFGTGGDAIITRSLAASNSDGYGPGTLALQPDGRILQVGSVDYKPGSIPGESDYFVARFTADGRPDTTFGPAPAGTGTGGFVTADWGGAYDAAAAVVTQPGGRVVVAGLQSGGKYPSFGETISLIRYLPDGRPDPSFGANGRVQTPVDSNDRVSDLLVKDDGTLVLVGTTGHNGSPTFAATVVQYKPGGALDAAFGGGGISRLNVRGDGFSDGAGRGILLPGGDVLVAGGAGGTTEYRGFLTRVLGTSPRVGGQVYADDNADGIRGAAEEGIPGVSLTLTGTDARGNPVAERTITDGGGRYAFTGLAPSNAAGYAVTVSQPDRYKHFGQTSATPGSRSGVPMVVSHLVVLPGDAANADFGEAPIDYIAHGIMWDEHRGPGVTGPRRGFDFTFDVLGTDDQPDIAFYWADSAGNPITPGQPVEQIPAARVPSLGIASPSDAQQPPGGKRYTINLPARWGTPPVATRGILAVLDPPDGQNPNGVKAEADETNNVKAIQIHAPTEVVNGKAVKAELLLGSKGPFLYLSFIPGLGEPDGPFTLSEAEVSHGVDHFNWVQTVAAPTPDPATGRAFRFETWQGSPTTGGTRVEVPETVYDPVVSPTGREQYFLRITHPVRGTTYYLIDDPEPPDPYQPYVREDPADWSNDSSARGGTFTENGKSVLLLLDSPRFPAGLLAGKEAFSFSSRLVGIGGDHAPVPILGVRTGISWESNAAQAVDLKTYFAGRPEDLPPVVGGGIFAVRYDDGTAVPGFPTDPPPISPLPASQLTVSGLPGGSSSVYAAAAGQYPASPAASLTVFPGFTGPTRSAVADVDGDGVADTVLVTGPGTPVRFAVVSGADHATLLVPPTAPFAGSEDFAGGGFAAAADLDADGRAEVIVTPDQGGGPRVAVFSAAGGAAAARANFFGITGDDDFRGGCRPALGDVNRDGTPDLAVAAGFLGGPRVAVFDGTTVPGGTPLKLVNDFFAFPGGDAVTLRNGSFVAVGDVSGDGFGDLVFGGGPGGSPRVFVLSGALLAAGDLDGAYAAPVANFFVAGNSTDRGGVRVAAKDADGDGRADLAAGSGEGAAANVRVYLGKDFTSSAEPAAFQDLGVAGGAPLPGGVYVG